MNESAILDTLKAIENSVGTTAALTIATFMLVVATLIYAIVNSNKK